MTRVRGALQYLVKTEEVGLHVRNVENQQSRLRERRQISYIKILMQRKITLIT
jgi:hypothetical protein